MRRFGRLRVAWLVAGILVWIIAGCTSSPGDGMGDESVASSLTLDEATAVIQSAMEALNAGDYAGWSQDWSDAMKEAIQEPSFLAWRRELMDLRGNYVSCKDIQLIRGGVEGYVRWVATCDFEKGQVRLGFSFKENGNQVEGVFPELVNE